MQKQSFDRKVHFYLHVCFKHLVSMCAKEQSELLKLSVVDLTWVIAETLHLIVQLSPE